MGPIDLVLAPLRVGQQIARAAEDLHDLAERARREPDPVEEARGKLDELLREVREVRAVAQTIVIGGRDLRHTGEKLDVHAVEIIDGGAELTEVARDLSETLDVFRAAMPRLLDGLGTVEELEEAVETVADTVEPLQGVARGVGRVSNRLSRQTGAGGS